MSNERELNEVDAERARQDVIWGEQNHDASLWLMILVEEVGEVAKDSLDGNIIGIKQELIQVAAVAIAMLQSLRRKGIDGKKDE